MLFLFWTPHVCDCDSSDLYFCLITESHVGSCRGFSNVPIRWNHCLAKYHPNKGCGMWDVGCGSHLTPSYTLPKSNNNPLSAFHQVDPVGLNFTLTPPKSHDATLKQLHEKVGWMKYCLKWYLFHSGSDYQWGHIYKSKPLEIKIPYPTDKFESDPHWAVYYMLSMCGAHCGAHLLLIQNVDRMPSPPIAYPQILLW